MSDFITKPAFFSSFSLRLRTALEDQGVTDPDLQDEQDWFEANQLLAVYGVEQPDAMLESMAKGSPRRPWSYEDGGAVFDAVDALLGEEASQDDCRATCIDLWVEAGLDESKLSFEPRERGTRKRRSNRFAGRVARRRS